MGQRDTLAFRLGTLVFGLVVLTILGFAFTVTEDASGLDLAVELQPAELAGLEEVLKGFRSEYPSVEVRVRQFGENPPVAHAYLFGSYNSLQSFARDLPLPHRKFSFFLELHKVLRKKQDSEAQLETLEILQSLVAQGKINPAFVESQGDSLSGRFLPILWAPYGLFSGRPALENRGLSIPKTWEELESSMPLVLGIPGERAIELSRWIFERQGLGGLTFDRWKNQGSIHPNSPSMTEEDVALLLQDGRISLALASLSLIQYLPIETASDLRFTLLPPRQDRNPMIPARIISAVVPNHAGETPGVQELLEYLSRPQTQELWVSSVGSQIFLNPVRLDARFPNETGFRIAALARNVRVIRAE